MLIQYLYFIWNNNPVDTWEVKRKRYLNVKVALFSDLLTHHKLDWKLETETWLGGPFTLTQTSPLKVVSSYFLDVIAEVEA